MINKEFFESWVKATHASHGDDPTDFDGNNPICCIEDCDKQIEHNDDHCEDHQRCVICGDNDDCDCEDEWSQVSACCEARMSESGLCYSCKDHCCSSWEAAVEEADGRIK
jgi:hypothetical protein